VKHRKGIVDFVQGNPTTIFKDREKSTRKKVAKAFYTINFNTYR